MAKAKFQAIINGDVMAQGFILVAGTKKYVFRGVTSDGTGIRATVKGRSSEWCTLKADDFEDVVIKPVSEKKVVRKTTKVESKAKAPAKSEVQRYSKQRAREALSERIRVEDGICSYKMNGIHLTDNKDGTVTQHGGFTAHGHARKSQTYTNAVITMSKGGSVIIDCINCTGDKVRFIHDPTTQETYLFVKSLGGIRKVF